MLYWNLATSPPPWVRFHLISCFYLLLGICRKVLNCISWEVGRFYLDITPDVWLIAPSHQIFVSNCICSSQNHWLYFCFYDKLSLLMSDLHRPLVKPFRNRRVSWFNFLRENMIVDTLSQAICEEMPYSLGTFHFFLVSQLSPACFLWMLPSQVFGKNHYCFDTWIIRLDRLR